MSDLITEKDRAVIRREVKDQFHKSKSKEPINFNSFDVNLESKGPFLVEWNEKFHEPVTYFIIYALKLPVSEMIGFQYIKINKKPDEILECIEPFLNTIIEIWNDEIKND